MGKKHSAICVAERPRARTGPENNCLYAVLGVSRNASPREITDAYHSMALKAHPDKPTGSKEAFQEIAAAYEILSDEAKRAMYMMKLIESGSRDGLNASAPPGSSKSGGCGHILADHPDEMVRVLLASDPRYWQQLLESMAAEQLQRLIESAAKSGQGASTRRAKCSMESRSSVEEMKSLPKMTHLAVRGNGEYQAKTSMQYLDIISPRTRDLTVAVFYHSAAVQVKRLLMQKIKEQPTSSFGEVLKSALKQLAAEGMAIPFTYRSDKRSGGKNIYGPCVEEVEIALKMREDLLQAGKLTARMRSEWSKLAKNSAEAMKEARQQRAVRLCGYLQSRLDMLRSVPVARIRKAGKQAPDMLLQVPLVGALAQKLGQPATELQRRLACPEGQRVLMGFLRKDPVPALRNEGVSLSRLGPLEVETIFWFTSISDSMRLMQSCKKLEQDVGLLLTSFCSPKCFIRPMDFDTDVGLASFLASKFTSQTNCVNLTSLPVLSCQLWAALFQMATLQRVVISHGSRCDWPAGGGPFAIEVRLASGKNSRMSMPMIP